MDKAGGERAFARTGRAWKNHDATILLDRRGMHDQVLVRETGDGVVESPFDQRQSLIGGQRLEWILAVDEKTRLRPQVPAHAPAGHQRDMEIGEPADGIAELRRIEPTERLDDFAENGRQRRGEWTEPQMHDCLPHYRHATCSSKSSF